MKPLRFLGRLLAKPFRGLGVRNVTDAVKGFKEKPLYNTAYLLTTASILVSAIVCVVFIAVKSQSFNLSDFETGSSYADWYFSSIWFIAIQLALGASLVLYIVQSVKNRSIEDKVEVGLGIRYLVVGELLSVALTPLLLQIAENIEYIIGLVVVIAVLIFMAVFGLSSKPDGTVRTGGGNAKTANNGYVKVIKADPKKVKICDFAKEKSINVLTGKWYVECGTGLTTTNNYRPLCNVGDYEKGKVKFVDYRGREFRP